MKHAKSIEEAWEEKLRSEKEKMLMEFLNKKFRDHIARHKKKIQSFKCTKKFDCKIGGVIRKTVPSYLFNKTT